MQRTYHCQIIQGKKLHRMLLIKTLIKYKQSEVRYRIIWTFISKRSIRKQVHNQKSAQLLHTHNKSHNYIHAINRFNIFPKVFIFKKRKMEENTIPKCKILPFYSQWKKKNTQRIPRSCPHMHHAWEIWPVQLNKYFSI